MTFEDYIGFRIAEGAYTFGFWLVVFLIGGAVVLCRRLLEIRRDRKRFERMLRGDEADPID